MNALQHHTFLNLAPGDFVYGLNGKQSYTTILGSCISVVLWHPASRFYAMCHYISPQTPSNETGGKLVKGRYADQVLPYLERQLCKHNIVASELELVLCGGASSAGASNLALHYQIARLNIEAAHQFIRRNQLQIKFEDTGGKLARRLKFDSRTGGLDIVTVHKGVGNNDEVE